MSKDTSSIGDRLRRARRQRGFSQEELAVRSGVSARTIINLEGNKRSSASARTIIALAYALDTTVSELMDRHPRLTHPADDSGMLGVRDALQSLDTLPGLEDGTNGDGETPSLTGVGAAVRHAWRLYWLGRLGDLAVLLPALLRDARAAERVHGKPAAGLLAQADQLAADLAVHMGSDDLAYHAARLGMQAAARGNLDRLDGRLQHATLAGTVSWILLHQGRPLGAEEAARKMADRIEPSILSAPMEHLVVHGALLLSAAAGAANAGRADAVREYLGRARASAVRFTGGDRHDFQVSFGPTQVAMQAGYAWSVLEQPDTVLAAARNVRREDLFRISWGAHLLDVANANLQWRRNGAARDALLRAHAVSPEWYRHQGPARAMTVELKRRHQRLPDDLNNLVRAIEGLPAHSRASQPLAARRLMLPSGHCERPGI